MKKYILFISVFFTLTFLFNNDVYANKTINVMDKIISYETIGNAPMNTFIGAYERKDAYSPRPVVRATLSEPTHISTIKMNGTNGVLSLRLLDENNKVIYIQDNLGNSNTNIYNRLHLNVKYIEVVMNALSSVTYYLNSLELIYEPNKPSVPKNLKATNLVNAIKLTWTLNNDDTDFYYIYQNGIKIAEIEQGINEYIVTDNLIPDQNYSFQISAVNIEGESNKSNVVFGKALLPEIEPELSYENLKAESLRLIWDNVAPNYEIFKDNELYAQTHLNFMNITNLEPNTTYEFYVIAIDKYGRKVKSNTIKVTTETPLPKVPDIKFKDITHDSFKIEWSNDAYSNGFSIYLDGIFIERITENQYHFSSLEPNTVYSVRVVSHGINLDVEKTLSITTKSKPIPKINNAYLTPVPSEPNKRILNIESNDLVTEYEIFLNGESLGIYPVTKNRIEIDFTNYEDILVEFEIVPLDENAEIYIFQSPVHSTGMLEIDNILSKFVSLFGINRNAFLYIALASLPLLLIVVAFFFFRKKFKKAVGKSKDDHKPFGIANQKSKKSIYNKSKLFAIDKTQDERHIYQPRKKYVPWNKMTDQDKMAYRLQKNFKKTGFHNKQQYVKQYKNGQGRIYVVKGFNTRRKLAGNNFNTIKKSFQSNVKKF